MYCGRKIKYLEWRKNQEKICTAGFVKAEGSGEQCKVQIQVTGWPTATDGSYEVWLNGDQEEVQSESAASGNDKSLRKLGDIVLSEGKGNLIGKVFSSEEWFADGEPNRVCGIRIPLGVGEELYCQWSKCTPRTQSVEELLPVKVAEPTEVRRVAEEIQKAEETQKTEESQKAEEIQKAEETRERKENQETEETQETEKTLETEETVSATARRDSSFSAEIQKKGSIPQTLTYIKEHKWQQLSAIYPHISPFRDERDYLSVTPEDFVILPEGYYGLVGNSFLLHGYYNYGHLILCRKLWRGQARYYLGVPGNFFEREREVAILFGFESFESKQEPASEGDYGYYLKRIEL